MRLPSFALALLFATTAVAGINPPEPINGPIRVIDGDTVQLLSGERVRIYNIDAPETHKPRCQAESVLGEAAAGFLTVWLNHGGVTISRCEVGTSRCKDRYGRTLATISTVNIGDVGDKLVALGVALPWQPGRAAKDARASYWCGGGLD